MRGLKQVFAALIFSCSTNAAQLIAAASDLRLVLPLLLQQYQAETGVNIEPVFASSGKLSQQIQHGAPFSLFLAADSLYTNNLLQQCSLMQHCQTGIYGQGQLVIWYHHRFETAEQALAQSQHIAIADPNHAPYGKAALAYLQQHALWSQLQPKIRRSDNAALVLHMLSTGQAEVGFIGHALLPETRLQQLLPQAQQQQLQLLQKLGRTDVVARHLYPAIRHSWFYRPDANQPEIKTFLDWMLAAKQQQFWSAAGFKMVQH
ncbi:molybdate ABC transporter substrate-binding protein [Rheinheimera mangrovi]|uniref:molybdate ABC transporter substrate-binding protein n=1 Tax=Rheinheimera mangrovi TaxID=2498451 RepID=UPI000F8C7D74|nr:molybdate ABC transporter substrate-binding protein [Rheinheimera mangrovi]